jgi:hypothetical protein
MNRTSVAAPQPAVATKAPTVDTRHLETQNKYVAWIDVMGSGPTLVRSVPSAINFILKLQAAAVECNTKNLVLYPMNDGLFIVSDDIFEIRDLIQGVYERIHLANARAGGDMRKVFLARASIAFGPVFEGSNLTKKACPTMAANMNLASRMLIGPPVVNAYQGERHTGPFGIFVHESARVYPSNPWSGSLMRYWSPKSTPSWLAPLKQSLTEYLNYCDAHSAELDYPMDRINEHRRLAREFFEDGAI